MSSARASALSKDECIRVAARSADWILSREVYMPKDEGSYWPSRDGLSLEEKCDLYYGNAGILLFLGELYKTKRQPAYAEASNRGEQFLAKNISSLKLYGLYDGLAGIAFALAQLQDSPDAKAACSQALDRLAGEASRDERGGVRWNSDNDIISGSAGIGLTLLVLGQQLGRPDLVNLAVQTGADLLSVARTVPSGRYWLHQLNTEEQYPNFSHGTAGIGYFLLKLYEQTDDRRFLEAAVDAGRYLKSIASSKPATRCLIPHSLPVETALRPHPPGWDQSESGLFYLGWCHGPAGTGRFFHELSLVTHDTGWQTFLETAAQTIRDSGIPEQQTPGYWNNVSRCCGATGVAEFFLARYRTSTQEPDHQFALRIGEYLVQTAELDGRGLKWIQAENRIQPDKLLAQTGLMQGAAGIGLFFLHLARVDSREATLLLPDGS